MHFLLLHGYYRAAPAELRVVLELMMIGAYGNLKPRDSDYVAWRKSGSEFGFTRARKRVHDLLDFNQCKWLLADKSFPARTFRQLCSFTHSRPDSSDGALWQSNGPIYAHKAFMLTFGTALSVYAIGYLLARIARPGFALPSDSRILFEEDWVPNRLGVAKAFQELFGESARRDEYAHEHACDCEPGT